MIWIIVPTHNESPIIRATLARLVTFGKKSFHEPWRVVIVDNGSTDRTRDIVQEFVTAHTEVIRYDLEQPGKGAAVMAGWKLAEASTPPSETQPVFCFLDADLACGPEELPPLINAIRHGADIAVGSRRMKGAQVQRSILRRIVSASNAYFLRLRFGLRVQDAPCGCKAVTATIIQNLLPLIHDQQWFFDTELLIRAERNGFRIEEMPVTWNEPRAAHGTIKKLWSITTANIKAQKILLREFRNSRIA
jgi:glycosyltransferase involved in cell wall biosynthesis